MRKEGGISPPSTYASLFRISCVCACSMERCFFCRPFDAQVPPKKEGEQPRSMLMLAVQSMLAFPLDTAGARTDSLVTLSRLVKGGVSLAPRWFR